MAQLVEQMIRNHQVAGSSPAVSSIFFIFTEFLAGLRLLDANCTLLVCEPATFELAFNQLRKSNPNKFVLSLASWRRAEPAVSSIFFILTEFLAGLCLLDVDIFYKFFRTFLLILSNLKYYIKKKKRAFFLLCYK